MPKTKTSKREFRCTRLDKMVRGVHAAEVPSSERTGYYIRAKSPDAALAIMTARFPDVEVEIDPS